MIWPAEFEPHLNLAVGFTVVVGMTGRLQDLSRPSPGEERTLIKDQVKHRMKRSIHAYTNQRRLLPANTSKTMTSQPQSFERLQDLSDINQKCRCLIAQMTKRRSLTSVVPLRWKARQPDIWAGGLQCRLHARPHFSNLSDVLFGSGTLRYI